MEKEIMKVTVPKFSGAVLLAAVILFTLINCKREDSGKNPGETIRGTDADSRIQGQGELQGVP